MDGTGNVGKEKSAGLPILANVALLIENCYCVDYIRLAHNPSWRLSMKTNPLPLMTRSVLAVVAVLSLLSCSMMRYYTPDGRLLVAAQQGDMKEVKAALADGANVNARGKDEATPLMVASLNRNSEIAKHLIENGADVNAKGKDGKTALKLAQASKHTEVVKYLISQGAK